MKSSTRSRLIPHGEPTAYFTFDGLAGAGLPHATTTRHCPGVSAPAETIPPLGGAASAVLAPAGVDLARLVWARQVHGARVAVAPHSGGFVGAADAIVTGERAVPLAVVTADCLAITLWDPDVPALGVAHAGWRGTAGGVTSAVVQALTRLGAEPGRLRVAIGPSIGPCCYEVDGPVADVFARAFPGQWRAWFEAHGAGHFMLDLWRANESLLAAEGVRPERIENARVCTACHPELLYSYRRGNRGRLVTVAALA
jgi:YfiH family protein